MYYAKVPEIHKFEAMLKWAKHYVKKQGYTDKLDAKVDFRNCMDRLSRDLKLYRISPQDLIKELFKHSLHQTNNLLSFVKSSNGGCLRVNLTTHKYNIKMKVVT